MRLFFIVFPAWIALIVGVNIASGPVESGGTAWEQVGYGLLMLLGAAAIFAFQWLIFKFVRSYAAHSDRKR